MAQETALKVMLSSTVYGNQHIIEAICATLEGYGYKVLCSHLGTIYNIPGKSPEYSCLAAVEECDFFFGIIFPHYGSGITHKEFQRAIDLNKPRGFLAHSNIPFLKTLLKQFMYDDLNRRTGFALTKKTTVLDSLEVVEMYNLAIGDGQPIEKRLWAQPFFKYELDGAPFVSTQFEDYERFKRDLEALQNGEQ
ncbi:DUF4062 domain-containing protein [Flavobacterium sp. 245]|uniref:DUF4062 domain-containing protein n=1 Tax=Flavobacterium sp. 245 TaxID=2512115 RepID=UPI00105E6417|nr:DUF4062 domain-containing protein [Flavobacterium sp. 245]TDP02205.1 uncharacterized protein DUF4062 [Flavobacterium sp. 245]